MEKHIRGTNLESNGWLYVKNKCCNQHSVGLLAYVCGSVQLSTWLMSTKWKFLFSFWAFVLFPSLSWWWSHILCLWCTTFPPHLPSRIGTEHRDSVAVTFPCQQAADADWGNVEIFVGFGHFGLVQEKGDGTHAEWSRNCEYITKAECRKISLSWFLISPSEMREQYSNRSLSTLLSDLAFHGIHNFKRSLMTVKLGFYLGKTLKESTYWNKVK